MTFLHGPLSPLWERVRVRGINYNHKELAGTIDPAGLLRFARKIILISAAAGRFHVVRLRRTTLNDIFDRSLLKEKSLFFAQYIPVIQSRSMSSANTKVWNPLRLIVLKGDYRLRARDSRSASRSRMTFQICSIVIPDLIGNPVYPVFLWIPAFAGMTNQVLPAEG